MSKKTFVALALTALASVNIGASQHYTAPKQFSNHEKSYQRLNKANYRNQRKRK